MQPRQMYVRTAGVGGLILLAFASSGCFRTPAPEASVAVPVVKAEFQNTPKPLAAEGFIVPTSTVGVGVLAGLTGRVTGVYVDVGFKVKKGQLLAEIDRSEQLEVIRGASAMQNQALNNYKLVLTPYRPEQIHEEEILVDEDRHAMIAAKSKYDLLKAGNRREQIEEAKDALASAKAQLDLANAAKNRDDRLYAGGDVALATKEALDTTAETAKETYDAAKLALSILEQGNRPEEIESARQLYLASEEMLHKDAQQLAIMKLGSRPEAKAAALAEYQTLASKTKQAENTLTHSYIYAPADGLVIERNVNPGEIPSAGSANTDIAAPLSPQPKSLFVLAQSDKLNFQANFDESFFPDIKIGQGASVGLEAEPGTSIRGRVVKLEPNVSPAAGTVDPKTGRSTSPLTFNVWIQLIPSNLSLVSGQPGFARIDSYRNAIVVPLSAVSTFSTGDGTAFVVKDGIVHKRHIRYEQSTPTTAMVLDGLSAGDMVAVGRSNLAEGQHVQVRPANGNDLGSQAY